VIPDSTDALFLVEVLAVLAMPGPTNSLLFVSGATRGLRAGLHLPVTEVMAYLISLSLLVFVIGPSAEGHSIVSHVLRVLCGVYLAYMAVFLWRSGQPTSDAGHPITALRIFVTTLVNPKNLFLAFVIFPAPSAGSEALLLAFVSFSLICILAGSAWMAAGAFLHSVGASKMPLHHFYRGEAFLLAGFAIVILLSAYYSS